MVPTSEMIWVNPQKDAVQMQVSSGEESTSSSTAYTYNELPSTLGMKATPLTLSEFVVERFSALSHVHAILAGESSNDVTHVWIMISEWTPSARKAVYDVQKTVMKELGGFHNFDFYVVDIPAGNQPEELVSDLPVIFNRAKQEGTPINRSE